MKLNINNKIEEIRQKPEHIRLRYVWGMVALCMFFIIVVWGISLKENFQSINVMKGQTVNDFKTEVGGLDSSFFIEESASEKTSQSITEINSSQ